MMILDFYEAYGRGLATRLANIAHSDQQNRFVLVDDADSGDELVRAAASNLPQGVNVLVWQTFTERLSSGRLDNYHLRLEGNFTVLRKVGTDKASIRQSVKSGRELALKVVALMLQDSLTGELEQVGIRLEFESLVGSKIDMGNGWAGWGYDFDLVVPLELTLSPGDLAV